MLKFTSFTNLLVISLITGCCAAVYAANEVQFARIYFNNYEQRVIKEERDVEIFLSFLEGGARHSILPIEPIMKELKTIVDERITYYQSRLDAKIDNDSLLKGFGLVGLGAACIGAAVWLHKKYYSSWNDEVATVIGNLNGMNVTVQKNVRYLGNETRTEYTFIKPQGLSQQEETVFSQNRDRLVEVEKNMDFIIHAELSVGIFSIVPFIGSVLLFKKGFYPSFKEKYEKLMMLSPKIEDWFKQREAKKQSQQS
jgi:hypothetical protein